MTTILYISVVVLMFSIGLFSLVACWGIFEDTEVGQMIVERMRKKHEEREEQC